MLLRPSFVSLLFSYVLGQVFTGPEDPRISIELSLDTPATGATITTDGRVFLNWARVDGSSGPQVVEYDRSTNTSTAFPNEEWNNYSEGKDPATHLIGVNGHRIGPDGQLWIVDKGSPAFGSPVNLPYGPKLVVVNLSSNTVSRVYPMGNVTLSASLLDDIRFGSPQSHYAYLTDAGAPGLIVLDLVSGNAVRVLNDHYSTTAYIPVSGEGSLMYSATGPFYVHADQLEVSPDGKYLYFQPCAGNLYRIETKYLHYAFTNSSMNSNTILGSYVEPLAHTHSTGGTAIDSNGDLYVSDTDSQRIMKIAPNGTTTTLVQDPRLLWVDAMWIDSKSTRLWMPAAQLNRGVPFHNGTNLVTKPVYVYSIDIGAGPSAIDHP